LENALRLSNNSGRTGCRAFCQRGILRRKNKDDTGAKDDFEKAAKLGSQFARNQVSFYYLIRETKKAKNSKNIYLFQFVISVNRVKSLCRLMQSNVT